MTRDGSQRQKKNIYIYIYTFFTKLYTYIYIYNFFWKMWHIMFQNRIAHPVFNFTIYRSYKKINYTTGRGV